MRRAIVAAGFAIALGLCLAPAPGDAQGITPKREHDATPGKPSPVLFSADEVSYDDQLQLVIARGNVELSQAHHTLLADTVSYNEHTDTVIATGHVSLIEDLTGETTFSDYVELHDQMRDGFIKDVRMLLADRSRLAGNAARRTDGNRTEVAKGVYSPCDLCKDDPTAPPLWQIKAVKIVHDRDRQTIEYFDATLELGGIPVFYTPYMSHPDPSVKRQSGFLPPTLGSNSLLGFNATIPYYWVIGPDKDMTFSPMFMSAQKPLFAGEYRERFGNGTIDVRGSLTDSQPLETGTGASESDQWRGHLFATGLFDIDENYRAGFDVQRTSDLTYLQEYKFGGYQTFLNSNAHLEDFDGRNYGSVYAYDFQSLREGVSDRTQAVVLPVADYTWAGRPTEWGGRFTTTANALDLVRETGSSDERVSVGTQMDLPFSGPWGQRFNLVAGLRGDGYYVMSQPLVANGPLTDGVTARLFPQIGLEWRDPWVRRSAGSTWLIEPIVAFYAAPVGGNPSKIPNDDSIGVDFNETDLFTRNRFVGYDQVDGGQRVDYGIHGAWYGSGFTGADALIGQSYRLQNASPFSVNGIGDGLQRPMSDYVGRIQFTPDQYFDLTYRFRFDQRDLASRRQEIGTNFGPSNIRIALNYLQLGENIRDEETPRQQISTGINLKLNAYWSMTMTGTHDLSGDGHLLAAGIGAQYTDECLTFVATLGQDGTVIGNFRPGTTLLFQFVLKNLGEISLPSLQTIPGSS